MEIEMIKRMLIICFAIIGGYSQLAVAELLKDRVFVSDGQQRTYDLYLPNNVSKKPSPLVLLLHGHFGNADVMTGQNNKKAPYKVWLNIADREGWVLVIPDGAIGPDKARGWNDCRANSKVNSSTDDVKFLNSLVDTVSRKYPINKRRIYAHGTSNGGLMVLRLALESGYKYRGIAAVVASMPKKSKCRESKAPISVLVMNGTADRILPYYGGAVGKYNSVNQERGTVLSTTDTIQYWLNNNDIRSRPRVQQLPDINKRDRTKVVTHEYFNGNNNTEVVLYEVQRGGHVEPSLSEHYRGIYTLVVGKQNKDIEMAEEVWKFFDRNR